MPLGADSGDEDWAFFGRALNDLLYIAKDNVNGVQMSINKILSIVISSPILTGLH